MYTVIYSSHPDCFPGEKFVRNADKHAYEKIVYLGKRKGTRVLSHGDHGKIVDQSKLSDEYKLFPVFAPAAEVDRLHTKFYGTPTTPAPLS